MIPTQTAMEDRKPAQYAAGSLAASAFVATTQILTRDSLDLPLKVAVVLFAVNIPFQIILFFMPMPFGSVEEVDRIMAEGRGLSRAEQFPLAVSKYSRPAIVAGFVAMFWHFAWWIGVLFGLAAWAAYRIYSYCAWEDFNKRSANHDE